MNKGVEILIGRMKTNPEDFARNGRFHHYTHGLDLLAGHAPADATPFYYLSDEDRKGLRDAWCERTASEFANNVMRDLLRDTSEEAVTASPHFANASAQQMKALNSLSAQQSLSAQHQQTYESMLNNQYQSMNNQGQIGLGPLVNSGGFGSAAINGAITGVTLAANSTSNKIKSPVR